MNQMRAHVEINLFHPLYSMKKGTNLSKSVLNIICFPLPIRSNITITQNYFKIFQPFIRTGAQTDKGYRIDT